MADVVLYQIKVFRDVEGDAEQVFSIHMAIDGRVRVYVGKALTVQQSIKDAYFYHTGKLAQLTSEGDDQDRWVFTDEAANPADFEHLETVPPWSTD